MIFAPSKFVALDDNPEHLLGIIKTFESLGTPCLGIRYRPEEDLDSELFRGVRCLFVDLHLNEGHTSTDDVKHFATLLSILEEIISPLGGPYVLILWTQHEHKCSEFEEYVDKTFDRTKLHCRPLSIIPMPKEKFINLGDGAVKDLKELKSAIQEAILDTPHIAAMLAWERDVIESTARTLSDLIRLVPPGNHSKDKFPEAVDDIYSKLASAAVGEKNVDADRRTALTMALAPILVDHLLNQFYEEEVDKIWRKAITKTSNYKGSIGSPAEVGRINRMLHLSLGNGNPVGPTDWGSVVDFETNDITFRAWFGGTKDELLSSEYKITHEHDRARCTPKLVRIGAPCDYAQSKSGPINYILGFEIPHDLKLNGKLPVAIWPSPLLCVDDDSDPFLLCFHARYALTMPANETVSFIVRYRIREQLLMTLINHVSSHASRPGIISLSC